MNHAYLNYDFHFEASYVTLYTILRIKFYLTEKALNEFSTIFFIFHIKYMPLEEIVTNSGHSGLDST
jgi:hypothetical protein